MLGILIAVPYTYLKVLCDYKKKNSGCFSGRVWRGRVLSRKHIYGCFLKYVRPVLYSEGWVCNTALPSGTNLSDAIQVRNCPKSIVCKTAECWLITHHPNEI